MFKIPNFKRCSKNFTKAGLPFFRKLPFSTMIFAVLSHSGRHSLHHNHCVKSVQIRNFFWSVFSCIQSETGKYGPEIIPYLDTFHAVVVCSCYNFIQKDDSCRDALSPMIDALALLSTASVGINAISRDLIK